VSQQRRTRPQRTIESGGWALLFVALLAVPPTRGQTPDLLIDAPAPAGAVATGALPGVKRQRWATLNRSLLAATLPSALGGTDSLRRLTVTLFPDMKVTLVLDRTETTSTGFVWVGHVEGMVPGDVTLAVSGDAMAGAITTPQGAFAIRHVLGGLHVVQERDPSTLPPPGEPIRPPAPPPDPRRGGGPRTQADDGSTIDVLVVYTSTARNANGGTSGIRAAIDLDVSQTNQAYQNSGVVPRLRLVGAEEIAYAESSDSLVDLNRLQAPADGFLDSVHARRDVLGADLVHLIANAPDVCGRAFIMQSPDATWFDTYAFGLTDDSCLGNYSFGHELGHNMGLQHDTYVTPEDGTYAYAHGYVNQAALLPGAPSSKRWRDIMAYGNQCGAAGFSCQTVAHFSNPNVSYLGDPTGTSATADGARAMNNTRSVTANFRQSGPRQAPPVVTTLSATFGQTSFTLAASVDPQGADTLVFFDYGLTAGYGTTEAHAVTQSGTGPRGITRIVTGRSCGTQYHYRARAQNSGGTTNGANVTFTTSPCGTPPTIFTHPLSQAVPFGQSITLSVLANGTAPFTYQWHLNSVAIPGATGSSYATGRLTNSGRYSVRVRNITDVSTFSNEADVSVVFSDNTLVPRATGARVVHVTELRERIDGLRGRRGLPAFAWASAPLGAGSLINAQHILDLREALRQWYVAALRTPPVYTDPALSRGTSIRAVHITELRSAVTAAE